MSESKNSKKFIDVIEDFLYSDSIPATATKFLLAFLALGTVVFAAALAPGMAEVVRPMKKYRKFSDRQIKKAAHDLKRGKLIEIIKEKDDKIKVSLTNRGMKRVKEFCFENIKIQKPKRWDGKWRVLIFDIPTKPKIYNRARDAMRHKVKKLGFFQLQKSVWVYPYECEDELLLIAEIYNVQKFIEILTVEKLLHEKEIRNKFEL
ncbi:MAG: hypothetical protein Q7S18_00230 [bacterium]|nr:hypothetical protein [bacterium]